MINDSIKEVQGIAEQAFIEAFSEL